MEDRQLKIRVTEKSVTGRNPMARRSFLPWFCVAGGALAMAALGFVILSSSDQPPELPVSDPVVDSQEPASVKKPLEVAVPATPAMPFEDDGKSLWAAPTAGEPLELSYLLPGTQLIVHVRVADLLRHAESEKVLTALGPWGQQVIGQIKRTTGAKLSEIETLLFGARLTRSGNVDFSLCLHLKQPWADREIDQRTCFLPDRAVGKVLVCCSAAAMPELVALDGEPPLFSRELQRVLKRTDATRTATLVFAGKFLQISGEKFMSGRAGDPLRELTLDFLGNEATATALSAHWDKNFFLELQSTVALSERPHRFAALLEKRVAASSDRVENTILAESLHPYGRKVLARFPAMLRKLGNYTRSGEEQGLSVLRCYLPIIAGHNLLMATELLLNTPTSGEVMRGGSEQAIAEAEGIEGRLQKSISLVFPKETLQRALEMLSEDIGVPIEIAGRDLQLEGITKNQSFAIELRAKPAAEVLLDVLLRANPDRTATGPTDVKQKLVYTIRNESDQQRGAIVVTTRAAVQRRGDKLPVVFEATTR